ncbi:hypothetical protein C8J57DRAFT_1478540 [Mycena rebaudengoi]|nr:hypothetical protein C8J57DRAFT_1478540 [Mycena rebaudengoi]
MLAIIPIFSCHNGLRYSGREVVNGTGKLGSHLSIAAGDGGGIRLLAFVGLGGRLSRVLVLAVGPFTPPGRLWKRLSVTGMEMKARSVRDSKNATTTSRAGPAHRARIGGVDVAGEGEYMSLLRRKRVAKVDTEPLEYGTSTEKERRGATQVGGSARTPEFEEVCLQRHAAWKGAECARASQVLPLMPTTKTTRSGRSSQAGVDENWGVWSPEFLSGINGQEMVVEVKRDAVFGIEEPSLFAKETDR